MPKPGRVGSGACRLTEPTLSSATLRKLWPLLEDEVASTAGEYAGLVATGDEQDESSNGEIRRAIPERLFK